MFQTMTLEMSLKPFRQTDDASIAAVCREVFSQWKPLLKDTKDASIMLWAADGSEILDYRGLLDDEFEWCYYVGTATCNPDTYPPTDPEGRWLETQNHPYMDPLPKMTYGILKKIVTTLKQVGKEILGDDINIRVGETFDLGPEFAYSSFKYERHTELAGSRDVQFIDCSKNLHGDDFAYAGYPNGVPEGTPFATFLGKQANLFLKDMGFDYLWLSNGVGFSANPWSAAGTVFDGTDFHPDLIQKNRDVVLDFWKKFREECPDFPIETRGTNFSAGIDYATSAVPLYALYQGGFQFLPPANSPWAAIDGNFGLELMGHMSRIALLPEDRYQFRYYLHDPWFVNSPWYDRYEGQPHDIYLPMSLARIDENGLCHKPTDFHILSIDNTFGQLPIACVNEPIPHLQKAYKDAPDAPPPLLWVYPARENTTATDERELYDIFAGDWFICEAINETLPLSGVVATDHFIKTDPSLYQESILLSPIPQKESEYEACIMDYCANGGKVIFYGNPQGASDAFLKMINITITDAKSGVMAIENPYFKDIYIDGNYPHVINIKKIGIHGGLNTVLKDSNSPVLPILQAEDRVLATKGENVIWFAAPLGSSYQEGNLLLQPDSAEDYVTGEKILRTLLSLFGYEIHLTKPAAKVKSPVMMVARCENAFMFSTYTPSTTTELSLKFPQGAPLLLGYETVLKDGFSNYHLPRAEHRECRIFIEQDEDTLVSCVETTPESYYIRRCIKVTGLKNATVRFYPEPYAIGRCAVVPTTKTGQRISPDLAYTLDTPAMDWHDNYCEIKNVTGGLVFGMPRKDLPKEENWL